MRIKLHYWVIFASLLWLLFLALSPVISRDALIHHLALPKLWLEHGLFSIDTYRVYAFYPSNLQAVYQAVLFYDLEFLAKIIHSLFLFVSGCLVYQYLRHIGLNNSLSSLGFFLTLTIPICQRLASQVYVDLGLLFFTTLSLVYFLYWKHSDFLVRKYFYIFAVAAGLALGTKYNGILIIAILFFICVFTFGRHTKQYAKALGYGCGFVAIAIMLASPWLIRNYAVSGGNPFFPLLTSLFPDTIDEAVPLYPVLNHTILYRMIEGESLTEILMLPLRIFFDGQDDNFLRFDGKLNPMMLVLAPLVFLTRKDSRQESSGDQADPDKLAANAVTDKFVLLVFVGLIIFVSLSSRDVRIRYLIPIITPVVMLNVIAIDAILSRKQRFFNYAAYLSVGIYIAYNVVYGYEVIQRLDHVNYLFGREERVDYLKRKVSLYSIYDYINAHTEPDSVVYDVMNGHRSYYVDREYMHHPRHVDTVFMNYMRQKKTYHDYESYLSQLETRNGMGVSHLLIRPYLFMNAYTNIFPDYDRGAIENFIRFLNRQKLLIESGDSRLYELVSRQARPKVIQVNTTEAGG